MFVHEVFVESRKSSQLGGADQAPVIPLMIDHPVQSLSDHVGVGVLVEVVVSTRLKSQQGKPAVGHLIGLAGPRAGIDGFAPRLGRFFAQALVRPGTVRCLMPGKPLEASRHGCLAACAAAVVSDPLLAVGHGPLGVKAQLLRFGALVGIGLDDLGRTVRLDFYRAHVPDVSIHVVAGAESVSLPALIDLDLGSRSRQAVACGVVPVAVVVNEVGVGAGQHAQHGDRFGTLAVAIVDVQPHKFLAGEVSLLVEIDVKLFALGQGALEMSVQIGRLFVPGKHDADLAGVQARVQHDANAALATGRQLPVELLGREPRSRNHDRDQAQRRVVKSKPSLGVGRGRQFPADNPHFGVRNGLIVDGVNNLADQRGVRQRRLGNFQRLLRQGQTPPEGDFNPVIMLQTGNSPLEDLLFSNRRGQHSIQKLGFPVGVDTPKTDLAPAGGKVGQQKAVGVGRISLDSRHGIQFRVAIYRSQIERRHTGQTEDNRCQYAASQHHTPAMPCLDLPLQPVQLELQIDCPRWFGAGCGQV